jgi:hypothetical protein
MPGARTLKEFDQQIVSGAESPVLVVPKLPDFKPYFPMIKQNCLDRKSISKAPQ